MKTNNKSGERALTKAQVDQVVSAAKTTEEKLLMQIGFNVGLRRDDLVSLELKNIKLNEARIDFNEKKKGNRIRSVSIPQTLVGELSRYIITLPKTQVYLFPAREINTKNGYMSSRTAYTIFNKLCGECGIRTPIPIHAMRSTSAKILKQKGWSIEQVAKHLGDTVQTVQHYYTVPSSEEMKELMARDGGVT